jgi:hypothetical protein
MRQLVNRHSAHSRRSLLSFAVAAALAITEAASATSAVAAGHSATRARGAMPHSLATVQVTNCASSGPGSLSAALATAGENGIVDLNPLKHVCSTISADSLTIMQNNLYIEGPGAKYLSLDGAGTAPIVRHLGSGTLSFSGLTLTNGYYASAAAPKGGCVASNGSIALIDSTVSHCTVKSTGNADASGGAVYAKADLHLLRSTITGNHADGGTMHFGLGGAAVIKGKLTALYSTLSENDAFGASAADGVGGAAFAYGDADIESSTISGNKAGGAGGIKLAGGLSHTATIINSSVSSNVATTDYAGIWNNENLTIANSTIAFNHATASAPGFGQGLDSTAPVSATSTIIADNSDATGASDLGGSGMLSGSEDLIVAASSPVPMGTLSACPKLDALADNGGPTLTHALNAGSPAIDVGSASMSLTSDQRLAPRVSGAQADIGSVERQSGDHRERILAAGFDKLCDQ